MVGAHYSVPRALKELLTLVAVFFSGVAQIAHAGGHKFSSVEDGIYALGKAHIMRSTSSLRSFPNVAPETVRMLL